MKEPVLKFIGDEDLVVPLTGGGSLLSHPDYVNHYFPTVITVVDAAGTAYRYRRAKTVGKLFWIESLRNFSQLYKIEPELIGEPSSVPLTEFKKKVIEMVGKTSQKRGMPNDEKRRLVREVSDAVDFETVISSVAARSYWK